MNCATLTINLNAIFKNLKHLQNLSHNSVETAAVLKANAYGLGVDPIAKFLFSKGIRTFFVSTVDEAVELKTLLPVEAMIYYLNGFHKNDGQAINEFNIWPVLNSIDQIKNFLELKGRRKAALQIDIGMKRLGLDPSEALKIRDECKVIDLNLILGHLSSADDRPNLSNSHQLGIFSKFSADFPGIRKSLAATGGIILGRGYHFDLTRPGIGLFGGKPLHDAEKVVNLNLPVIQVRDIKKNDGVGYNHAFVARNKMKIAVVGAGYADGLFRQLSNRGFLYAEKEICPILGRVSMDLITVDISALKTTPATLTVLGPFQTIDDLAEQSNTIGYEILTSLGSRYKRVYHY